MNSGQVIAARYELHEVIGRGGMGEVFRADDRRTGQIVAVKALKPEVIVEHPELVERFRREAAALRKLNHPNIVKVLDTIEEGERRYIVMEYVSGGTLADLLQEQPQLAIERVLSVALELADALSRAHHMRIIHRDLKPGNVLLAEDGTPRLTDFGVAHVAGESRLTETESLIGTYAYLSPEACHSQELDERADIWSFGVMLYEMLAGQRPFTEMQPGAVLTAILTHEVPDLKRFRPETPPSLDYLIRRMLSKDRNERIASARQVGAELEIIMRGLDLSQQAVDSTLDEEAGDPPVLRLATSASSESILPAPSAWLSIPAGKVTLGTYTTGGYITKTTTFDVPAFAIAKYPVTNAQFALFIEAGGYQEKRWWTEEGRRASEKEGWTEPRFWQASKWNGADHPVVGVSWYEAIAFCRWLSEATGETILLPTEQQWQRAAQGNTGWAYPWGDKFDASCCNFYGDGSTPVTQYEGKGDSPFGVVDMVGNVWEWCLTEYETGRKHLDGIGARILRGGSWLDSLTDVLSTVTRERSDPDLGYVLIGFRCVRL